MSKEDLIVYRNQRAIETLKEAELLMNNGSWNAAINRIYYSCYYLLSGLLLKKDIESSSHKGIRQMFGLHFIQTGLVSKEDGRFFSELFDLRHTGDYDDFVYHNETTVIHIYDYAKGFMERILKVM